MSDTPTAQAPSGALVGRRLLGIGIDWVLCLLISSAFFVAPALEDATGVERVLLAGDPTATLIIWAAQHLVLVSLLGTTIGHRVAGLRVVREDGAPYVGPLKGLGRTVLLGLVIPAVVWGPDGRGLHDRAMGTRVVDVRAARP
ncbi:RDD family protein [Demequina sp. NBRC 110057]|uniref:RDD family protein n=1 Tax=Demequina sp. NBRC 110057 TaxID=1570346 RepID=UPI00135645B2|nr:RDD family protein [Demequina sp. NBRC 110057]